jgi:uncharacterized protein YndB with AHSA1/START domain
MAETQSVKSYSLDVRRTVAAPIEKVFEAFTKPEIMKRWFCLGTSQRVEVKELDLRVGGRLRVEVTEKDGRLWKLISQYVEVSPPRRLAFTWQWDGHPEHGETLVTVELRQLGQSSFTEVHMHHGEFPNAKACGEHVQGWSECFDNLDKAIQDYL